MDLEEFKKVIEKSPPKCEGADALKLITSESEVSSIIGKSPNAKGVKKKGKTRLSKKIHSKFKKIAGDATIAVGGNILFFDAKDTLHEILEGTRVPHNEVVFEVYRKSDRTVHIGSIMIVKGILKFNHFFNQPVQYNEFQKIEKFTKQANISVIKHCSNKYLPIYAKRMIMKIIRGDYINTKLPRELTKKEMFTGASFKQQIRNNRQIILLGERELGADATYAEKSASGVQQCIEMLCNFGMIKEVDEGHEVYTKVQNRTKKGKIYQLSKDKWYNF